MQGKPVPATKGGVGTVQRRDFENHMIEDLENGFISKHKIWFNDETHFQLNGYLGKQKWLIGLLKIIISESSRHCIHKG